MALMVVWNSSDVFSGSLHSSITATSQHARDITTTTTTTHTHSTNAMDTICSNLEHKWNKMDEKVCGGAREKLNKPRVWTTLRAGQNLHSKIKRQKEDAYNCRKQRWPTFPKLPFPSTLRMLKSLRLGLCAFTCKLISRAGGTGDGAPPSPFALVCAFHMTSYGSSLSAEEVNNGQCK